MQKYYIISAKHTHVRDKWISFWRPDGKGYCWFKEWAGLYDDAGDETDRRHGEIHVEAEVVDHLWIKINYEGTERFVILNTPDNRSALDIQIGELKESWPTKLGHWEIVK